MIAQRKKIISANWKMNITSSEVAPYLETFLFEKKRQQEVDVILFPSFTSLPKASELLKGSQEVRLGAQNISSQERGAFTGEISAAMLRDLFVSYVLIGHSERRHLFGETDAFVHEKLVIAYAYKIRPVLCIGETLQERQAGKEKQILEQQLQAAFQGISLEMIATTIIAYEPVWAIGTGCTASVDQAQEAHHFIREVLSSLTNKSIAQKMRLQYGGSATPKNAKELLSAPDIDGLLVGSASWDPRSFAEIVAAASQ